jgi:hypothetical protein
MTGAVSGSLVYNAPRRPRHLSGVFGLLGDIDMSEEFFLRSGLSNLLVPPEIWIAVTYLAGMFLVLAFRPQQIAEPSSFRLSYILFTLYFIVPGSINALLLLAVLDSMGRGPTPMTLVVFQVSGIIGKVLLGLSIVFAFGSMIRLRASGFPDAKRAESNEATVPGASDELQHLREENLRLRKRLMEGGRSGEGFHEGQG